MYTIHWKENREALRGKHLAAFACQSGAGAEKAFAKLKALLSNKAMDAELVLIDLKDRPSEENKANMKAFYDALRSKENGA